jgi:PAS domain S-box-containing protein
MDIELMGEIDGIETVRTIRERFDVPVIYLTAYVDDRRLEAARGTAPYGYIVKPFIDRELLATIQMALHRHTLDRKLKVSEERYRAILDNLQDGIVIADPATRQITDANRIFSSLSGYPVPELRSISLGELFDDPAGNRDLLIERIYSETGYAGSVTMRKRNGTAYEVELIVMPVAPHQQHGAVGIMARIPASTLYRDRSVARTDRGMAALGRAGAYEIAGILADAAAWNERLRISVQDPAAREQIRLQQGALDAAGQLIRRSMKQGDELVPDATWVPLKDLLDAAAALYSHTGIVMAAQGEYELLTDIYVRNAFSLLAYLLSRGGGVQCSVTFGVSGAGTLNIEVKGTGNSADDKEPAAVLQGKGSSCDDGPEICREVFDLAGIRLRTIPDGEGSGIGIEGPPGRYRKIPLPG